MAASESKKNVRLPEELSEGEQKATASRKEEIKKVLTKHGVRFDEAKIPNIAILGSGGGLRAMIALYGTLAQLKKCGLLDCVMYLCGVSGSTWCMSALYKNEDWAKIIEDFATLPRKIFTSNSWELTKAIDALRECVKDECYSLTDFWAYFVVYMMLKELHESTLSDQQKACENGKNPYPIYAAVDKHTYYEEHKACSWFEFTPHEVGVLSRHDHPGNGAYIATENFGSKFNKGKMVEKKKERNISFLQGLWGSALGSGKEIRKTIEDALRKFKEETIGSWFTYSSMNFGDLKVIRMNEAMKNSNREKAYPHHGSITNNMKCEELKQVYKYLVELHLLALEDKTTVEREVVDFIGNILQRYGSSESYELFRKLDKAWLSGDAKTRDEIFIKLYEALDRDLEEIQRGGKRLCGISPSDCVGVLEIIVKTLLCISRWTWGTTNNFMKNCDVKSDHLNKEKYISLMDAGVAINSAYPLVLHPKRNVKLILSFDFSAGGPFETLYRASEYCENNHITFPDINKVELPDKEPSNCYIFKTKDLTIMHFPLFNKDNCKGKIEAYWKTYGTFKMSYSEQEIADLLEAAKKNVEGAEGKIRKEIERLCGHSS